jgi:hypothetical protein
MRDELGLDLLADVRTILKHSRFVIRTDSALQSPLEPDVASTTEDEDGTSSDGTDELEQVILEMGHGYPEVHRVAGEEFIQVMTSVAHPPAWTPSIYNYRVGEWVSVARPGSFFGDIAFVVHLFPSGRHRTPSLTVACIQRDCERGHADRGELLVLPTSKIVAKDDPPAGELGRLKFWADERGDKYTRKGLLLRNFLPWELRRDGVDGAPLTLTADQAACFEACIDDEFLHDLSLNTINLPKSVTPMTTFASPIPGEVVLVNGHQAITQAPVVLVGQETTPYWWVHSMNTREGFVVHRDYLLKRHEVGAQVWSFLLRDTATVISYDAFKEETCICWGQAEATVHPNTLRSPLVGLSFDDFPGYPRLIHIFLRQLRFRKTLVPLFFQRPVFVVGSRITDVKGHLMTVQRIERVSAIEAKVRPLDSGIKLHLYDSANSKEYDVDYDEVRDAE